MFLFQAAKWNSGLELVLRLDGFIYLLLMLHT